MKTKSLLLIALSIICCVSAFARDNYTYDMKVLPESAQTALTTYFGKKTVNHIKIDKDIFGIDGYDVVLSDGTEIEFDSKGNIKEVDSNVNNPVPDAIIMKPIRDYVAKNYPSQKIVKYDVKRSGYEIELQSGVDLVFNAQGNFVRIDR